MSLRRRGSGGETLNPWPGYVDALSTLLMVIIFVLLVFVLAQAFLGVALSGKDRALDRLNRQMAELTDMLSLERGHGVELQAAVAGLTRDLCHRQHARDQLNAQVGTLQQALASAAATRDSLQAERTRLVAQLADSTAQAQSAAPHRAAAAATGRCRRPHGRRRAASRHHGRPTGRRTTPAGRGEGRVGPHRYGRQGHRGGQARGPGQAVATRCRR